jgi:glycosyltransferase involved in cell wall biosynthesis
MRIVIVADTYPPLRTSGAVQLNDLAREFALQGHEPTVIVPTGALEAPWKVEYAEGVKVLRCRTPQTKDIGYVRRTINELRLPYSLLRALRRSEFRSDRWDGVVWYSPSIFLAPIVRVLRRESRCRSYLVLRDIFPEWAVDMGLMKRGGAYHFFKMIERMQYSVADTVGVQSPANLAYLSEWAKRPGRRLEVLQNWLSDAPNTGCRVALARSKLAGRKIFVYAGNMGVAQGMDVLIELAVRMRHRQDIGFLFVGRGSDANRVAAMAESQGLDNVMYHDEIEPIEIPGLLAHCHVGIVALDPRHKTHNVPGKFLAYLRAGIPVLARINTGNDLERLINEERVGLACIGGDAATLEKLADEMLANPAELRVMGDRGKSVWKRLFAPSTAVKQIVSALSRDKDTGERHSSESASLDGHRRTFVSPSVGAREKE